MQRTKKKVQQSKPNHLVARRLSSQAAPPGTTPPAVARARSRPSPRVRAIHIRFQAPRERRFADARSPSESQRSAQLETLPSSRRTAGGGGCLWRLETPEGLPPPLTHSLPQGKGRAGRRNKGEAWLGRRTEVRGEEGVGAGPGRRRESILQPFPARNARCRRLKDWSLRGSGRVPSSDRSSLI